MKKHLKLLVFDTDDGQFNIGHLINLILAGGLVYLFIILSLKRADIDIDYTVMLGYSKRIFDGYIITLAIGLGSIILSLLIGTIIALMKSSRLLIVKYFGIIYIEFIRGTPLLVQIYLFYYLIGTAWGIDNRIFAGVMILSIFEGAYIAEIIRGSYQSIDQSQLESARAVGLSRFQTMRYVIIPQMVSRTLPALAGQSSSIIKDSSLLSIIAIIELTHTVREISAFTYTLFEAMLLLGLLYLTITLPISYLSKLLERKFNYAD